MIGRMLAAKVSGTDRNSVRVRQTACLSGSNRGAEACLVRARRGGTFNLACHRFGARTPRNTPTSKVVSVDRQTEDIGRHQTPLSGTGSDDADDDAVDSGHEPPLPHAAADQNGGRDRQQAGDVIEMEFDNQGRGPLTLFIKCPAGKKHQIKTLSAWMFSAGDFGHRRLHRNRVPCRIFLEYLLAAGRADIKPRAFVLRFLGSLCGTDGHTTDAGIGFPALRKALSAIAAGLSGAEQSFRVSCP